MSNSSGKAASSTMNGIFGRLAHTDQATLAPLSRRIFLFAFVRGLRAAKPAALTPGYDSRHRSAVAGRRRRLPAERAPRCPVFSLGGR